uniref:Uncharacterized protein n=1 Tax=Pithovirus LCPAC101 TaxID=2506586 RepID=A0A481Z2A5_9VIRU|nr:MAG: hypothetical protein LCPAC101_01600 [Pithovirus LCPAC101]
MNYTRNGVIYNANIVNSRTGTRTSTIINSQPEISTTSNYYIALIIITIIGFTLSIILSFYFVYLPAQRSSAAFDDLFKRGTEVVDSAIGIADDVNDTATTTSDFLVALCTGIEEGKGQLGNLKPSFQETCDFIIGIDS